MNDFVLSDVTTLTLIHVREARPATYSLDTAAQLAGVHPDRLRYFCRIGLFGEAFSRPQAEPAFDDDSLFEVRRFEGYRRDHGVDRKTLRLICSLWREVERLQAEVRQLRAR